MNETGVLISTNNKLRREKWQRVLGVEALPVSNHLPREMYTLDGMMIGYDLRLRALSSLQLIRLAASKARELRRSYVDVLTELKTAISIPIYDYGDLYVTDEAIMSYPFFVFNLWQSKQRRYAIAADQATAFV